MALCRNRIPKITHHIILLFKLSNQNFINSAIYTNRHDLNLIQTKPICSNASRSTVEALISIFTRRPFSLDTPELQELSSNLTPDIVETVLKSFKNWRVAHMFFNWASNQKGYAHSCYTYNAMASILSNARQNALLRALALNLSNLQCFWTPGAFGYFIRCLGSQGLVREAIDLFDQVKSSRVCIPNSYSYNCLLEAISKSGDVGLIELRLNEMRNLGWQIDKHALTPLLQCYCNGGEFEKALGVFNEMRDKGWVDAHVLTTILVSFSKLGEVDRAFELIEGMERDLNISLNEKTFCVLIHGFVKESRVDKALHLLDKMRRTGFVPDISIYDVLIGGLCQNKETDKALMLCKQMRELGMIPDVKIISTLLSCLRDERDMIMLLEEKQADLDLGKRTLLCNSVLAGFVNNGSVDRAYHLLRAMIGNEMNGEFEAEKILLAKENVRPDTTSFQTVIDGLCKSDKLDLALGLFFEMDQIGCKRSVLLFNNLIDCLSNADRLDDCFDLLNKMKESGFQPTHFTFNSIFGCLCRRGDVAGALDMVREMRVHGHQPWIKYYTLLVKKLCEHGRADDARNFLVNMTQVGFLPDMVAYSATIYGFLKTKELDQALELFREICTLGYCPDVVAYNMIINGLCKAKRILEAEDAINEMLSKGLVPSVVTYNFLIDGWCKYGDIDRAILCFSRMLEEEQEPNVITYTTLVDGLCKAEKPDRALKLWSEMEDKGCAPNRIAYMALIHGLCKCGKPDDALLYLRKMEDMEMTPDAFVYEALIDAFMSNSNTSMAHEVSEKMARHKNTS
ncbi:putative pentatricopeptide repeat-containing protein [Forsythia ovata]|uniref:Pentatricopeptide repeat-containing protein n=1 Tax=Forsythia ovata TaxID=205694 RepID=A0ABD1R2L3_9LAMI